MSTPTEELIDRARGGDDLAYDGLFDRVADRLLVYVRCRLGAGLRGKLEPLDVLQETYVEAHRSFDRFQGQGPGSFTRWLYGIADHRIRDLAKHFGAAKRRPPGELVQASTALRRIAAEQTGASTLMARRERDEALVAAMDELPEREREALLLRFFQGRTLEEIAAALDTSERSVRRLLGNAMQRVGGVLKSQS